MKKSIFVVAGIIAIALAWYTFSYQPKEGTTPNKQPVKTITISHTPFQETASFSGFVRGERQADIAAKTSGYLVRLTKDEGDSVRRGETLAILDGSELSASKESALLSLQAMEQTLRTTEKYYDQKVDEAKTATDQSSGSARENAEEALKSAKRLRDAELSALRSQKSSLEGSLLISETNAANLIIKAPFDGIVTMRQASLGSLVSSGMPIYSIADTSSLEITVSLPENIARQVPRGSQVSVSDTRGGRAEGTVAALASAADISSQQSVARIRFASLPEDFRLGEHVQVSFLIGVKQDSILIPEQAIIASYDDFFVFVAEDGHAKRLPIALGAPADSDRREVLSGLSENTHVIVEGMHALTENQPIEETYAD